MRLGAVWSTQRCCACGTYPVMLEDLISCGVPSFRVLLNWRLLLGNALHAQPCRHGQEGLTYESAQTRVLPASLVRAMHTCSREYLAEHGVAAQKTVCPRGSPPPNAHDHRSNFRTQGELHKESDPIRPKASNPHVF
ncbi:unnamed protein product [Ectocarpus sp. 4 AP-2014]